MHLRDVNMTIESYNVVTFLKIIYLLHWVKRSNFTPIFKKPVSQECIIMVCCLVMVSKKVDNKLLFLNKNDRKF